MVCPASPPFVLVDNEMMDLPHVCYAQKRDKSAVRVAGGGETSQSEAARNQSGGLTMRLAHGRFAPRGAGGVRLGDFASRYPLTR